MQNELKQRIIHEKDSKGRKKIVIKLYIPSVARSTETYSTRVVEDHIVSSARLQFRYEVNQNSIWNADEKRSARKI